MRARRSLPPPPSYSAVASHATAPAAARVNTPAKVVANPRQFLTMGLLGCCRLGEGAP